MSDLLTLDRVRTAIEKQGVVVEQEITEATHFVDMGFDSLDRVEMEFAVEEELGADLDIDESVLDDVRTVGDLIRVVNASLDDAS